MARVHRRAGEVLAKLRERKGITQTTLASVLGVTPAHVSRIERGNRRITLAQIDKAAAYFRVPASLFLTEQPSVEGGGQAPKGIKKPIGFDDDGRARPCPNCNENRYGKKARYCPMCGWALWNFCISAERHVNQHDARRCEVCGQRTWWSFFSQDEIDALDIPADVRSSRSGAEAREEL